MGIFPRITSLIQNPVVTNEKTMETFPLWSGKREECSESPSQCTGGINQSNRKRTIRDVRIAKERKLFVYNGNKLWLWESRV